jgi:hypothetical protein
MVTPPLPSNVESRTNPHPELGTGPFPTLTKSEDKSLMRSIEEGFGQGRSTGPKSSSEKGAAKIGGRVGYDQLGQGQGHGEKKEDHSTPTPTPTPTLARPRNLTSHQLGDGALIDQGRKHAAEQGRDESTRTVRPAHPISGSENITTAQPEPYEWRKEDDHVPPIRRSDVDPSRSDDPSRLTLPYGTPLRPGGGSWTGPPRSNVLGIPRMHSYSYKGPKGASPNLIPLGRGGRGRYTVQSTFTGDDGSRGREEKAIARNGGMRMESDLDRNTLAPQAPEVLETNTQPARIHSTSISSDPLEPDSDSPEPLDPRVEHGRMGITRATVSELGSGRSTATVSTVERGPGIGMDAGQDGGSAGGVGNVATGMGDGVEVVEVDEEMDVRVDSNARGDLDNATATELGIDVAVARTNGEDTEPDEDSFEGKDEECLPSHATSPTSTSTSASPLTATATLLQVERSYRTSKKRHHPDSDHPSSSPIRSRRRDDVDPLSIDYSESTRRW